MPRTASSLLSLALVGALAGCHSSAATPQGAAPPIPVTVAYPIVQGMTDYHEYPGRIAAVNSLNVLPRVSGYLEKIYFADGAEVAKGAVLYLIDPRPYQAAYDQAVAQVKLAQANYQYTQAVYERDVSLYGTSALSTEELQQALSQRNSAAAQVTSNQAAVEAAKLNLQFTRVTSPIAGRIGRTLLTLGNLAIADQTLLTTVVSLDPMYVYLDVDEATVLRVQQLIREGKFKGISEGGQVPIYVGLSIENGFPHEGYVDFYNNQVTAATGTLQVRGIVANPAPKVGPRQFTPGMFVRVRVPVSAAHQAILIVQRALAANQNVHYVYVVNDQNQVERRDVTLGAIVGQLQEIVSGIGPHDRVIIIGLQHVQPGETVAPTLVPMPTGGAAAEEFGPVPVVSNPPPAAPAPAGTAGKR